MRRIIIIGAGPGGIAAGKRLKDAGYDDFIILEQAAGPGGTWWHNSYPGCRCDVPSHLYSFSFALKKNWSEPYAARPEVQAYLEDCTERFGLIPHIRFDTRVEAATWDEASACWTVVTQDQQTFTADILISAVGLFNVPAYPRIDGLDRFEGVTMHSARWDHDVDLAGKAVAVIGSAASAVQLAPEVASVAGQLDIYQRTPNYVRPREGAFEDDFLRRVESDPAVMVEERQRIWTWLNTIITLDDPAMIEESLAVCAENLAQVEDEDTRRRLTPDYPFGSKRGLVSSDWYPMFNRPNVALVTSPVERINAHGIQTVDGVTRKADVIILATGFETTKFLSVIPVTGCAGQSLDEAWADGARAYLGITMSGFPNLFMLYGPNTNNGSIIFQIECQVNYIVRKIQMMDAQRLKWIDLQPEELERYNEDLQQSLLKVGVWQAGVRDYYRADSGLIVTQWPHSMDRYQAATCRADDHAYDVMPIERFETENPDIFAIR